MTGKHKKTKKKRKGAKSHDDYLRIEDMGFRRDADFSNERMVLEVALENEIRGRKLYSQYAGTVKSEVARRVFIHLANEELRHIEDIQKFIGSLEGKIAIDMAKIVKGGSLDKTKHFFGKLVDELKEVARPSDDDNKSRKVAMRIERAGYEYYKKGAETTENQKLKKFFEFLMKQEQSHYMLIKDAFDYANDPDSWYAEHEHWLLEG